MSAFLELERRDLSVAWKEGGTVGVALGFYLGLPAWQAIQAPTPGNVQGVVKRALMSLILLDAILATATRAGTLGLLVLVLLAPSLYLNRRRWLYAT